MRQMMIWLFLSCKRYSRRLAFCFLLVLLPVGAFAMGTISKDDSGEIPIALYLAGEENAGIGIELVKALIERDPSAESMFRFYQVEDEATLIDAVAARKAECGYVIPSGLEEKLEQESYKRSIQVYSAPSTVTAPLSTEVVFAALMELYDRELLMEYVSTAPLFDKIGAMGSDGRKQLANEAGAGYDQWLASGQTFRFEYGVADRMEQGAEMETVVMDNVFPVRGVIAVYLFVIGLFAASCMLQDEKAGLFIPLTYETRGVCKIASLTAPVLLAAFSALAALMAGGVWTVWWREVLSMVLYVFGIVIGSYILARLVRRSDVVCCMIPFFAIASILFCPVFLDIGQYIHGVDAVGKWLLPYYYLQFF